MAGFSPQECRVDFVNVAKAGFVFLWVVENVEGDLDDFVPLKDVGVSLPLGLVLRLIIEKQLCVCDDAIRLVVNFFGDLRTVSIILRHFFDEEEAEESILIAG